MIRINLIAESRKPTPVKKAGLADRGLDLGLWALVGFVILGLLVAAGHWFLLNRTLSQRDAEIAAAQQEADELAPIIKEVEDFKAKKAVLQNKIDIISDLKAQQKVPVRIMDQVSLALPELMWLTNMQDKGGKLTITGRALNTNAVASFIENLDVVPLFQEPILKSTERRNDLYFFTIEVNFSLPKEPSSGGQAGGGA